VEWNHSTWNPPGMWGQGKLLDFRLELVFSTSLEKLEGLKCLALLLQAHGSSVGRRIIKEGDPVAVSFMGVNR